MTLLPGWKTTSCHIQNRNGGKKKWPWTSTVFAVLWNHTANESMVLRFCCQFQEESSILTVESEGLDGNRHSGTTAWNIVLWPTQIERYSGLLVVPKLRHMLVSFTSETLPGLRVCFRKNSIEEKIDESPLQGPPAQSVNCHTISQCRMHVWSLHPSAVLSWAMARVLLGNVTANALLLHHPDQSIHTFSGHHVLLPIQAIELKVLLPRQPHWHHLRLGEGFLSWRLHWLYWNCKIVQINFGQ